MLRIAEWVLAWIGALICLLVTFLVVQAQQSSGSSIWPLPAIPLLEIALLGFSGLISIALDRDPRPLYWGFVTWTVTGALAGLMVLGAFTIGVGLVPVVLVFALAALLADRRRGRRILPELGSFAIGTLGSMLVVLFLNVLSTTP
jgi:hypothetical protein